MNLERKTVLITGAAKRIGREIALTLARSGASIVIHYHRSSEEAVSLKRQIQALRKKAWLVKADFLSEKEPFSHVMKKFMKDVYREAGKIDVLINNASIFYPAPVGKVTEKIWDQFLTANLKVPFFLSQEFGMKMFRARSGKIVNLLDWTAFRPKSRFLPYAVSKAGLSALTLGLAKAFAPYVQVAGIAPGPILPPQGASAAEKRKIAQRTLAKRFGSPRDIAEAVRFVVEKTDYVTGTIIPVEGGAALF